ncbi:MAG: helix-turn-helix domain-containing protein [Vicinamibacterales bacterium]|nr:helix-turn-helix domain-containing protein [Vicinamibacterales bacterium]
MKRHGRSHVLERERAAGGHIMRARLTMGAGITRADRAFDNPHESRRTTLPILLTVDEAADLLRTTRRGIYTMIERRQLPGVIRIRRRVLLRAEDLLNWLDQKRAPSPEE